MSDRIYNFEDFKDALATQVLENLPKAFQMADVSFHEVNKSGVGKVTGMTIRLPDSSIAPCIYIDSAYEEYKKYNLSIGQIACSVAHSYLDVLEHARSITNDRNIRALAHEGFDWSTAKELCMIKAVPVTGNDEFLAMRPYRTQGDMAAVYIINMGSNEQGQMSVAVTNDLEKQFGVSEKELYAIASANMMKISPPVITGMDNMMNILFGFDMDDGIDTGKSFSESLAELPSPEAEITLNVLTNNDAVNGAAYVFIPAVMDQIAEKYPDGFYILPSSVHEVLIVPKNDDRVDLESLNAMVQEINSIEVRPEDRLSDFVHEYDPAAKSIYISGTEAPSKKQEMDMSAQEQKKTPKALAR